MSTFNYEQYQNVVAQAEANGNGTKVGYFKLKDDGDIAIARINISSTDDLMFASVHTVNAGGKWIKVNCLNPLGSTNSGCGLCSAYSANPKGAVGKSAKKLFIPMMVSYRDPNAATGYTPPIPVIWDRPAAFSRELANKLMIAGDLRNTLVLITRNGKAGDMQTTYSMDILPENHPVFKPEMIPNDFSGFTNFNIARHSYWEKTSEEINAFLTTGQFPEHIQTATATGTQLPNQSVTTYNPAPDFSSNTVVPNSTAVPYYNPNTVTDTDSTANATTTPTRNFSGFSF